MILLICVFQNDSADICSALIWPEFNLVSDHQGIGYVNIFVKSEILEKDDFPEIEVKSKYPDYNHSRAKTKREIIKELFDPSHYDPDTRPGEGMIPFVISLREGLERGPVVVLIRPSAYPFSLRQTLV